MWLTAPNGTEWEGDERHKWRFHNFPDDILFCSRSWITWTFWMEHYCGFLKDALRLKTYPWANLNNVNHHHAYLEQLEARYDLSAEPSSLHRVNGLTSTEQRFDGCMSGTTVFYPQVLLCLLILF
jgi:hypothetical protein